MAVRRRGNKLERWEIGLIKAMVADGRWPMTGERHPLPKHLIGDRVAVTFEPTPHSFRARNDMKVFWSWQSDRIPKNHHRFVRDALEKACELIAADAEVDESERPEVDHDTKGVAGTPDIVRAIAEKIDAAAAFVADMTPVAVYQSCGTQARFAARKVAEI